MEPAQKSDFSLLQLEQTQKQTDMLWLFFFEYPMAFYHFCNGQVTFQCS